MKACYMTERGFVACGDSRDLLAQMDDESIHLVITSPPFALQRQKEYGNVDQNSYIDWLAEFGRLVYTKLRSDGSFVLDLAAC